MSLEQAESYNGLPVCKHCGWPMAGPYEENRHRSNCEHVKQGEAANKLAMQLPEIRSTKFGYGTDRVVFDLSRSLHVHFECRSNGTFSLRELYCLGSITEKDAARLVELIHTWHKERGR